MIDRRLKRKREGKKERGKKIYFSEAALAEDFDELEVFKAVLAIFRLALDGRLAASRR